MTGLRIFLAILGLWLAGVWLQSMAGQSLFLGCKLDPILLVVFLVSIRVRPGVAAAYGFSAGLIQGGGAGADFTAFGLSRTIIAFAASYVARSGLQLIPLITGFVAAIATVLAQVMLMFMAPPPDIGRFLGATLGSAIYNGVVAGLLDALLRRTLDPQMD